MVVGQQLATFFRWQASDLVQIRGRMLPFPHIGIGKVPTAGTSPGVAAVTAPPPLNGATSEGQIKWLHGLNLAFGP